MAGRARAAGKRLFGAAESGLVLVIAVMVLGLTAYGAAHPKPKNVGQVLGAGEEVALVGRDGSSWTVEAWGGGELERVEVRRGGEVVRRYRSPTHAADWRVSVGEDGTREVRGRVVVNRFFELGNLMLLANEASFIAVIAVGMTGVIVLAGIDLSVGSIHALAGVGTAMVVRGLDPGASWWTAAGAAVGVSAVIGGALGVANGAMIVALRIHPFIITLGTMSVYRGVAFVLAREEGGTVGGLPGSLQTGFFKASPMDGIQGAGIHPVNTAIMVAVALAGWAVLERTVFGRRVYAIGGNETAARYAGIPVGRVKVWVYGLVGALAGLSAAMSVGYYGAATSSAGTMWELRVIAATVIGGASLTGGRGTALGAVRGAVIIELINNAISILGIPNEYLQVVTGAAIVAAVVVDRVKRGGGGRAGGA